MSVPNVVLRFIELATLSRVGLAASFIGLIIGQTANSRLYLVVGIVLILLVLALLRHYVPKIDAKWEQVGNPQENPETIVVQDRETAIQFRFYVPDHHRELYMTFEVEPYDIDVTQRDPANFDLEKGVTYHSSIGKVDLLLNMEMKAHLNSAGTVPLVIKDKLHNRTVAKIDISS